MFLESSVDVFFLSQLGTRLTRTRSSSSCSAVAATSSAPWRSSAASRNTCGHRTGQRNAAPAWQSTTPPSSSSPSFPSPSLPSSCSSSSSPSSCLAASGAIGKTRPGSTSRWTKIIGKKGLSCGRAHHFATFYFIQSWWYFYWLALVEKRNFSKLH